MQFPTGGRVRERKLNRCDSGTDSTVWMEEDFCAVTRAIWTVCLQHLKFVINSILNLLEQIAAFGVLIDPLYDIISHRLKM